MYSVIDLNMLLIAHSSLLYISITVRSDVYIKYYD